MFVNIAGKGNEPQIRSVLIKANTDAPLYLCRGSEPRVFSAQAQVEGTVLI